MSIVVAARTFVNLWGYSTFEAGRGHSERVGGRRMRRPYGFPARVLDSSSPINWKSNTQCYKIALMEVARGAGNADVQDKGFCALRES